MLSRIILCLVATSALFLAGCTSISLRGKSGIIAVNPDLEISATEGESDGDGIVIRFVNRSTRRILINTSFLVYVYRDTTRIVAGRNIAPRIGDCFPNSTGETYLLLEPMMAQCIKSNLWPEQSDWYQVVKRYSGCMFVDRMDSIQLSNARNPWLGFGRSCVSYFKGTDEQPLDLAARRWIDFCSRCVPCSDADSSMKIEAKQIYVPGRGPVDQEEILKSHE